MGAEFSRRRIEIPEGRGRRVIAGGAGFAGRVYRANVALQGFKFDFSDDDHHINVIEVDVDIVDVNGKEVDFRVECQYADKNFDDAYSGYIDVLVIAETDSTPIFG